LLLLLFIVVLSLQTNCQKQKQEKLKAQIRNDILEDTYETITNVTKNS
jgi:hypothetical protein